MFTTGGKVTVFPLGRPTQDSFTIQSNSSTEGKIYFLIGAAVAKELLYFDALPILFQILHSKLNPNLSQNILRLLLSTTRSSPPLANELLEPQYLNILMNFAESDDHLTKAAILLVLSAIITQQPRGIPKLLDAQNLKVQNLFANVKTNDVDVVSSSLLLLSHLIDGDERRVISTHFSQEQVIYIIHCW